jgi:hypothetical protein
LPPRFRHARDLFKTDAPGQSVVRAPLGHVNGRSAVATGGERSVDWPNPALLCQEPMSPAGWTTSWACAEPPGRENSAAILRIRAGAARYSASGVGLAAGGSIPNVLAVMQVIEKLPIDATSATKASSPMVACAAA